MNNAEREARKTIMGCDHLLGGATCGGCVAKAIQKAEQRGREIGIAEAIRKEAEK